MLIPIAAAQRTPTPAGGGITYVGSGGLVQTTATSTDLVLPSGLADGDYLVATLGVDNDETITPPSGWTEVAQNGSAGGRDRQGGAWYRVRDGSESDLNWSWTSSLDSIGGIVAYRGVASIRDTSANIAVTLDDGTPPNFQGTAPTSASGDVMLASLWAAGTTFSGGATAPSGMSTLEATAFNDNARQFAIASETLTGTPTPADWTTGDTGPNNAESVSTIVILVA